ncbi:MAG: YkgJ family cysteine cluster protein [Thermodesulfobacteriota bacterium]
MSGPDEIFICQRCGECCRGQGGIFLRPAEVGGPARVLGLRPEEFIRRFTEPRHGLLSVKTDAEGYCLLLDRETRTCRIHGAKPPMCRDWPFFHGVLEHREGFEAAKSCCPGLASETTWEEFRVWHGRHVGTRPPRSYVTALSEEGPDESG